MARRPSRPADEARVGEYLAGVLLPPPPVDVEGLDDDLPDPMTDLDAALRAVRARR
jgi:hypothetical protein